MVALWENTASSGGSEGRGSVGQRPRDLKQAHIYCSPASQSAKRSLGNRFRTPHLVERVSPFVFLQIPQRSHNMCFPHK